MPAVEGPGERVVGGIDRRIGIAEDREGDTVDVVGVVAVRALDGLPAKISVVHGLCTSRAA